MQGLRVQRGILPENRAFEAAERRTGLQAELLEQPPLPVAVHLKRLCLAAAPVERQHQLSAELLTQRMLLDESLKLTDDERVPPRRQLAVEALLQRGESSLLERRDLRLRPPLVREVGERRTAPQRKGLARLSGRTQALEARQIELILVDAEDVARAAGDDPLGAERRAEL